MQKIEFRAMGSTVLAAVDSEGGQAARRLEELPALFEDWEQALSRFRPDSDLMRLNSASGLPTVVSPVLFDVLREALSAATLTGGLVVPTLLTALESAGYDRSFDLLGSSGAQSAVQTMPILAAEVWRDIRLNLGSRTVTLPPGVRIDLGGIAKGWAADSAAAWLAETGPALVDAGGDIAVSGPMLGRAPWPVAIAHPLVTDKTIALLAMRGGAVATSGRDYRRWRKDGAWQHHILDPRTNLPAETDLMSASVIAPTTREAEWAAKAALILGSVGGLAWIEQRSHLAAFFVREDGTEIVSTRFDNFIWR